MVSVQFHGNDSQSWFANSCRLKLTTRTKRHRRVLEYRRKGIENRRKSFPCHHYSTEYQKIHISMNPSTPPLAMLDSERSIVNNTSRHEDPLLLQQHLMMSYHSLLNSTVVADNTLASTGDNNTMVRLSGRHTSEHEDDQETHSTCTGSTGSKSFPETVRE